MSVVEKKRALVAQALHALADRVARLPCRFAEVTMDEVVEALVEDDPLVRLRPDPTATDGYVDYCLICGGEPHAANCPMGVLVEIAKVGVDTGHALPPSVGLG